MCSFVIGTVGLPVRPRRAAGDCAHRLAHRVPDCDESCSLWYVAAVHYVFAKSSRAPHVKAGHRLAYQPVGWLVGW